MPIYEYKCAECGFQEEFLQKHSDPQLTVCPSCGKETFKKMLSAAGFQLKGSGWYATDFKGGGAKPAVRSGDEAKGESGGAAEKSPGESGGDKSSGEKSSGEKSSGEKSSGEKSSGDKPAEKSADKGTAVANSVPASTSG